MMSRQSFNRLIGLGALLLGLQLLPASVWAATLATYAYDVSGGSSVLDKTVGTGVLTADGPSAAVGVSIAPLATSAGNPAGVATSGWAGEIQSTRYVEFSLTANTGQRMQLESVTLRLGGAATASAVQGELDYSTDGTNFSEYDTSGPIYFSGGSALTNFTLTKAVSVPPGGTVTFRLMLQIDGSDSTGTEVVQLGNATNGSGIHTESAIQVNGYTTTLLGCSEWTSGVPTGITHNVNAVLWAGNQWVAVGATAGSGTAGRIYTSTDGSTWNSQTSNGASDVPLRSIAWSGQQFVAIGNQGSTPTMVSSADGVTWINRDSTISFGITSLADIVWTGSKFVVTGSAGVMYSQGSDLAQIWQKSLTSTGSEARITSNGNRLVQIGFSGPEYSDDQGANWLNATGGTTALSDVAWSGSQFVAVGSGGIIYTSGTGAVWTQRTSPTVENLIRVIWTGQHFVATGASNTTVTSADGITWTSGVSLSSLTSLGWSGKTLLGFSTTTANTSTCGWGDSLSLIGNRWTQVAVPAAAATPTVNGVFGTEGGKSGVGGSYTSPSSGAAGTWSMFSRNASANAYVNLANTGTAVSQSEGYWLRSWGGTGYDVLLPSGSANVTPLVTGNANCPSTAGCYEITLAAPSSGADRANLVSFPFPWPVGWWEARLQVNSTAYTLSAAQTQGYIRKQYYVWNGSTYSTFDDSTPGQIGLEQPWQGIWVMVKTGCNGQTCKLLIPAIPKVSQAPRTSDRPWLARALNWLIPAAAAEEAPPSRAKGLATRTTKQNIEGRSLQAGLSWYVRLSVEEPSEKMVDRTNGFGQLVGTHPGYDDHDLPALAPFGKPYLDLVFPHRDWPKPWGGSITDPAITDPWVGSYNSDYRPPPSNPLRTGAEDWTFEIRSDQARSVLLSWEGPERVIQRSELLDVATGKKYKLNAKALRDGNLWVAMTQPVQTFIWRYKGR